MIEGPKDNVIKLRWPKPAISAAMRRYLRNNTKAAFVIGNNKGGKKVPQSVLIKCHQTAVEFIEFRRKCDILRETFEDTIIDTLFIRQAWWLNPIRENGIKFRMVSTNWNRNYLTLFSGVDPDKIHESSTLQMLTRSGWRNLPVYGITHLPRNLVHIQINITFGIPDFTRMYGRKVPRRPGLDFSDNG